jgi:periplasmic protein TonB
MSRAIAIRPQETLRRFVYISMALHLALLLWFGIPTLIALLTHSGPDWGGTEGSVTVNVVGNIPAIPMPRPEIETPNRVVDDSKGLFKTEPKPLPKPAPDATPIPKFERDKRPKYITKPSKLLENPIQPPPNAIPYGGGGAPTIPTTSFALGEGKTQASLGFTGSAGEDFGSRFSWYVEAVQRRISGDWLQSSIDATLAMAPRVVVTFTIVRDGTITNVQITQSSNNYSVDNSALRAVRDSSPVARLPPEYAGSNVNVEFWFEFHR